MTRVMAHLLSAMHARFRTLEDEFGAIGRALEASQLASSKSCAPVKFSGSNRQDRVHYR